MKGDPEFKNVLNAKINAINKHYKHTVITTADKMPYTMHVRRSTGIPSLDLTLAGGFPPGVSCLSGPEGAGKTVTMLHTMAAYQRRMKEQAKILHLQLETTLDHFFFRNCGVRIAVPIEAIETRSDLRKKMGKPGFTKEEVKELQQQTGIFLGICASMDEGLDAVVSFLEDPRFRPTQNQFGLCTVDSINAAATLDSLSKESDDNLQRARHAQLETQFVNKLQVSFTDLDGDPLLTTILLLQQVRANQQKANAPAHIQKYLPDYAVGGAWALKHSKMMDIIITKGAKKKQADAEHAGKKEVVERLMCWETCKGRAGVHEGLTGEVVFDYKIPGLFDRHENLFLEGVRHGIIKEVGDKVNVYDPIFKGKIEGIPYKEFMDNIRSDLKAENSLHEAIMNAAGINCVYI